MTKLTFIKTIIIQEYSIPKAAANDNLEQYSVVSKVRICCNKNLFVFRFHLRGNVLRKEKKTHIACLRTLDEQALLNVHG